MTGAVQPSAGTQARRDAERPVDLDPRPVGEILRSWATATPEHPALLWQEGDVLVTTTYRQQYEGAVALARRLRGAVAPGGSVAAFAANSPDWVLLEYAAALAGVPLTPINPALADGEVRHILIAAQVELVLADEQWRSAPLLERARQVALPTGAAVHPLAAWGELQDSGADLTAVDPASPLLFQFTSGTTGRPKGAILSHRAAYNCAWLQMRCLDGTGTDIWGNLMPMHHVGGSVSVLMAVLSAGATMALLPGFEAGAALEMLEASRATITGAVPTMQLAMMAHERFGHTDLSALRLVQTGGSTVPTSLIRRVEDAFGAVVVNGYGQSESPSIAMTAPGDDDGTKAATIGRPLPHREVRIAGPDGATVELDAPGELLVRSPMVMDGYIGDPAGTASTIDSDGWLHTGDLCSMDGDGVLRMHGRLRDVIIRGGENIYPAEVEDAILCHPGVADVAVIGFADDHWGEVPVACFRAAPGGLVPSPVELETHTRTQLASFKVPRRWVVLDEMPTTASGKIQKFALRALLAATPPAIG